MHTDHGIQKPHLRRKGISVKVSVPDGDGDSRACFDRQALDGGRNGNIALFDKFGSSCNIGANANVMVHELNLILPLCHRNVSILPELEGRCRCYRYKT